MEKIDILLKGVLSAVGLRDETTPKYGVSLIKFANCALFISFLECSLSKKEKSGESNLLNSRERTGTTTVNLQADRMMFSSQTSVIDFTNPVNVLRQGYWSSERILI
ncbi:MAG: hypothetical protein R3224_04525 [Balneolaceae bacterium]|nr:hypothetical protein [Balneolaceae bacterium]